ncbi:MAG: sulfite exporter TauE/SafE family protein [Alcanivoracaceae bacterium]|nr:sulfite exporter TauE/SafE family protein [Alcanivoracaceae bacterium]
MSELLPWEYGLIALLFIWGGFVRSGLGFGGAVLTLPFLLMIRDQPLLFLPIISVHLLFFSGLTVWQAHRADAKKGQSVSTVNWEFLRYALPLMIVPKLIGVAGVITLPGSLVTGFIFCTVTLYAISYILGRPFKSGSKRVDAVFLMLGGYVSGVSLIAAPLVVPIAASRMPKEQLRDTLFVLWFVLVALKLIAFVITGVDLQWIHHLWLLPCATIGHLLGLRFHAYSLRADTKVFFRYLGFALLVVSAAGLLRLWLSL